MREKKLSELVMVSVNVKQYQRKWFKKHNLNLSDFIRKKIDEEIECQNTPKKKSKNLNPT